MTIEYSVDEMLSFYEETMQELSKTITDKNKAKRLAKKALHAKFPQNIIFSTDHSSERGKVIGGMAAIYHRYYPNVDVQKTITPEQYRFEAVENKMAKPSKIKFFDIMRCAGKTGFIPDFKFIAPFLYPAYDKKYQDMRTEKNIENYITHLRGEGYIAERNGKGWNVTPPTPKETPEEKAAREEKEQREKEIKALEEKIAAIMAQLEKLRK